MSEDVSSRSPCGERQRHILCVVSVQIRGTLSLRRATATSHYRSSGPFKGARSPCGERQRPDTIRKTQRPYVARSPCGERQRLSVVFLLLAVGVARSPCGERQRLTSEVSERVPLAGTLSLRRATATLPVSVFTDYAAWHALLAESDSDRGWTLNINGPMRHALLAESDSDLFLIIFRV